MFTNELWAAETNLGYLAMLRPEEMRRLSDSFGLAGEALSVSDNELATLLFDLAGALRGQERELEVVL